MIMQPRTIYLALLALLAMLPRPAMARSMIIFKDGNPEWAASVTRDGDTITYVADDTGDTKRVTVDALTGIIPEINRSKTYTDKQINTIIARIRRVRSKHYKLRRPMNSMLQQWEALREPALELDGEINDYVAQFNRSAKDPDTYKRISMELGMLAYKDVRGDYKERLTKVTRDMRIAFVKVNTERLEQKARATLTVDEFIDTRRFSVLVMDTAEGEEQTTIRNILDAMRQRTFETNVARARDLFDNEGRSVAAFREAMTLLKKTRTHVANTEAMHAVIATTADGIISEALEQSVADARGRFASNPGNIRSYLKGMEHFFKVRNAVTRAGLDPTRVEAALAQLIGAATEHFPGYDFSYRGYPLTAKEVQRVTTSGVCSTHELPDVDVEEECLMIPLEDPGVIPREQNFTVPLQFVFLKAQPPNRTYGIMLRCEGKGDLVAQSIKELPRVQVRNGRLRLRLGANLNFFYAGFEPQPDAGGTAYLEVYFAYLDDANMDAQRWITMSRACRWPLE